MGVSKRSCTVCPPSCHRPPQVNRDWENHPSWTAGIEALQDYNHWVEAIVLPIAFQWIEEHKADVYANIPEELKDDIGVVIAAAFKLVKELPAYQNGQELRQQYESGLNDGSFDTSATNPLWTAVAKQVRNQTRETFAQHSEHLGDTIP